MAWHAATVDYGVVYTGDTKREVAGAAMHRFATKTKIRKIRAGFYVIKSADPWHRAEEIYIGTTKEIEAECFSFPPDEPSS